MGESITYGVLLWRVAESEVVVFGRFELVLFHE